MKNNDTRKQNEGCKNEFSKPKNCQKMNGIYRQKTDSKRYEFELAQVQNS